MPHVTSQKHLVKTQRYSFEGDDGNEIAWNDAKIQYVTSRCVNKRVLDLGCVQHDPNMRKSRYWLHKAIRNVATHVTGIDLDQEGVAVLQSAGYNVRVEDVQDFDLGEKFDVIVVGDLIEHLENHHGFFQSCNRHMGPDSVILISTPNPWFWRRSLEALLGWNARINPEHTCWLCPQTLKQLASRFGFESTDLAFGSRDRGSSLAPLPRRWRNAFFYVTLTIPQRSGPSSPQDAFSKR